jgi:hypothetical protein
VPDRILLDEFHLMITVHRSTPEHVCEAARRVLTSRTFRTALRAAVQDCLGPHPTLARVRLVFSM